MFPVSPKTRLNLQGYWFNLALSTSALELTTVTMLAEGLATHIEVEDTLCNSGRTSTRLL
jgi:hypothetical protein